MKRNNIITIYLIVHCYTLLLSTNAFCSIKEIPFPSPKLTIKELKKHDSNKILEQFSLSDHGWIYFRSKSERIILTNKRRSKFFNFSLHTLAEHFDLPILDNENLAVIYAAFQDYENNVSPISVCYFSYNVDGNESPPNIKNPFHDVLSDKNVIYELDYAEWQKKDFEKIKKEALSIMAYRYKIHLQVKPEYLISFALDLAKMLHETKLKKLIPTFKITKEYLEGFHIPGQTKTIKYAVPTVVLYPALIPGSPKTKNKILKKLLKKITDHYKNEVSKISLNVKPRFNRKINDLVWLSGGCSCHKYYYHQFLKTHNIPNTVYTDDFNFIRGYEFK